MVATLLLSDIKVGEVQNIIFHTTNDGNAEIYVMNADGSNPTRLTNNPTQDRRPSWSPDGSKIAFQTNRDGNWEIYTMKIDGSKQTNLTNHPRTDYSFVVLPLINP